MTTVEPTAFQFVAFDADLIRRIADGLVEALGIDRPVHVVVDETTPLGRVRTSLGDTITIHVESGAFADSKRPREQSEVSTTASLGRALLPALPESPLAPLGAWGGGLTSFVALAGGLMAVESAPFVAAAQLPSMQRALAWFGLQWPASPLNLSLLLALAAALLFQGGDGLW